MVYMHPDIMGATDDVALHFSGRDVCSVKPAAGQARVGLGKEVQYVVNNN